MNLSTILKEVNEVSSEVDSKIFELTSKINELQNEKEEKIRQIKRKCKTHTYDDGVSSLDVDYDHDKLYYYCEICDAEIPLGEVIKDYLYQNKNIGLISNDKLPENLKQLLDIITNSRKRLYVAGGVYESFFEFQCHKQDLNPQKVFHILIENNVFKPSENNRGYVEIIK